MKIALLPQFNIEYTIPLANALAKTDEVLMIVWENLAKNHIHLIGKDVMLELLDKPPGKSLKNRSMIKETVRLIKAFSPDVVHIQSQYTWLLLGLSSLKDFPIVFTVHDPKPHLGREQIHYKYVTKRCLKYAKKVIVHGSRLKEIMIKEYDLDREKLYVVPHGNFSYYSKENPSRFKEVKNSVLYFGRIWEYKGLEHLINAEPLVSKKIPDVKIVIAGNGDFSRYRPMINNADRFEIINEFIPNDKVSELFQKASIVVLPYIEASQSGIVPVAYSFKKPVIATDVGSLPEVVDDGKTGIVVPPADHKALARAIIHLLSNDDLREDMGKNALSKAENELSWDSIAKQTLGIYKEML